MPPNLFRRGTRQSAVSGATALAAEPEVGAARLFLVSDVLGAWVPSSERASDVLNRESWLRARVPVDDTFEWRSYARSELLVVVPPPFVSPRDRRLHRLRRRVVLQVGRYAVTGIVQLPVGSDLGSFLQRTSCTSCHLPKPPSPGRATGCGSSRMPPSPW